MSRLFEISASCAAAGCLLRIWQASCFHFVGMGRPLRYLPKPETTFEVTTRTIQGRLLLKPSTELNDLVLGVVGRALSLYPKVLLHLLVVASNHLHMILTVPDSKSLSLFMCYVNSNIAREVGRLYHWREKFWGRRYRAIAILDEKALLDRARYILSHGGKENLVKRPEDWPGIHCVNALRDGTPLAGTWFDRTKEYEARRAGEDVAPNKFTTRYVVELAPLPCWANLSIDEQRKRFAEMITQIEAEIWESRMASGRTSCLGKHGVLKQDPHGRPGKIKKSKAPCCHCSDVRTWKCFRDAYREFVETFRAAARRLRKQRKIVSFPPHSFPPSVGYWTPAPVPSS